MQVSGNFALYTRNPTPYTLVLLANLLEIKWKETLIRALNQNIPFVLIDM